MFIWESCCGSGTDGQKDLGFRGITLEKQSHPVVGSIFYRIKVFCARNTVYMLSNSYSYLARRELFSLYQ